MLVASTYVPCLKLFSKNYTGKACGQEDETQKYFPMHTQLENEFCGRQFKFYQWWNLKFIYCWIVGACESGVRWEWNIAFWYFGRVEATKDMRLLSKMSTLKYLSFNLFTALQPHSSSSLFPIVIVKYFHKTQNFQYSISQNEKIIL